MGGLFRVCSMPNKTAETQACILYDTIVEELQYSHERGTWGGY